MKRILGALCMIMTALLLSGVNLHGSVAENPPKKKYSPSCGYTIIEFGLGIDCNGDTVKIIKKNGAQVLSYNN